MQGTEERGNSDDHQLAVSITVVTVVDGSELNEESTSIIRK
jgi:hypothetical protein